MRGPIFAGPRICRDQYSIFRGSIFTFAGTNFHIYGGRFSHSLGPISTFAGSNFHICADQYSYFRGPIFTFAGANSHVCGHQFSHLWGPIVTSAGTDIHIYVDQFPYLRRPTFAGSNISRFSPELSFARKRYSLESPTHFRSKHFLDFLMSHASIFRSKHICTRNISTRKTDIFSPIFTEWVSTGLSNWLVDLYFPIGIHRIFATC